MKKTYLILLMSLIATLNNSCSEGEINTEFSVTTSPRYLIPAKAASCYAKKIATVDSPVTYDIDESYFTIPTFTFWRAKTDKQLIIATIKLTYNVPTKGSSSSTSQDQTCVFAGDTLRALDSRWSVVTSPEAMIPAGAGTKDAPWVTDCAAICGGIKDPIANVTAGASIEIFGLERDPVTFEETPVKLQGTLQIQGI